MKNILKYILMTVMSLVIASICLFLPSELSKWKDKQTIGSVHMEKTEETKVEHIQQMTMQEKLWLYQDMEETSDMISITQGKYLKEEDIGEVCKKEVLLLQKMGLWKTLAIDFEEDLINTELNFYISAREPTKSMIVWTVNFYNDNGRLSIYLDDEMGKIVSFVQKRIDAEDIALNEDEFILQLSEYYGFDIVSYEKVVNPKIPETDLIQLNFVMKEGDKQFNCFAKISQYKYNIGFDTRLDKIKGFTN